ncbi:MAG TPA: formyltransferase family protein [Blastocatellia bacterium]
MNEKLRLIVLTHGGSEIAIERLAQLECAEIVGIFIETEINRPRRLSEKIKRSIRYNGYWGTAVKLATKLLELNGIRDKSSRAISESRDRLSQIASEHSIPIHFVRNYHTADSIALMRAARADLGVVLGTNILKETVFKIPRLGSINIHQGLAPYYRGCPAVFWELFNGEREVGLTIHFVESKVDTGDIILQRTVPLEYDYSYKLNYEAFIVDYRRKLLVPCANLIAESVQRIAEGRVALRPQDTRLGTRYRLPIKKEKDQMRRRLRERQRRSAAYPVAEKASSAD